MYMVKALKSGLLANRLKQRSVIEYRVWILAVILSQLFDELSEQVFLAFVFALMRQVRDVRVCRDVAA